MTHLLSKNHLTEKINIPTSYMAMVRTVFELNEFDMVTA